MVAAENWCIRVANRVYGPYSTVQMRKFAQEGRLAPTSSIAPAGSREWRDASREPALCQLFPAFNRDASQPEPTFGRRGGNLETAASEQTAAQFATIVLIFDVVPATAARTEPAIRALGPAFRIAENVWTVQTRLTATGVRNALAPHLTPREPMFVVDATRGKTVWQNVPPEVESKLKRTLLRPIMQAAGAA